MNQTVQNESALIGHRRVGGYLHFRRLERAGATLAAAGLTASLTLHLGAAERLNGFDVSNALIPREAILSGGPPRDGIPAIVRPRFDPASRAASFLKDEDLVVSVTVEDETRAYPLRILVWHETVNNVIRGQPLAITYCPLCGTAMVFDRRVGERTLDFGLSGLLYQSDVLMYDRQTESLWSQLAMQSVAGATGGPEVALVAR